MALAKRTGLTMWEANELTIQEMLDYASIYAGADEDGLRMATQADIDAFFS